MPQSNRPFNQHATEGQPQTFTKYIKNFIRQDYTVTRFWPNSFFRFHDLRHSGVVHVEAGKKLTRLTLVISNPTGLFNRLRFDCVS